MSRSQHRLRPLVAALAAVFASGALAQAPAADDATLPEVRVRDTAPRDDYAPGTSNAGARVATPLRDIPQSVTVINRAVMEAQGATSLADVLRSVPGITIGAAEGGSIGNNFNLRGFTARTDLYLDNMRDRGQVYRDVFTLEQVEVLKGPSSMLFGRGSTGGVINQVSKLPSLTPRNEASISGGTQPSLRATADLNQPLGDSAAFRVMVMGQDVHSTRDVMQNKDYGAGGALRFGIGSPTEVTLAALVTRNNDMADYGLPPLNGRPAPVDRHNFYGVTDDRTRQDVTQLGMKVTHKVDQSLLVQNQTRYSKYVTDARESGPNNVGTVAGGVYTPFPASNAGNNTGLPTSQLFVGIGSHDRVIRDESVYNQTDLIKKFELAGMRHELLVGLEVGSDKNNVNNSSRNLPGSSFFTFVNLEDPAYFGGSNLPSTQGNVVDAKATTVAPYVNDTISLSRQWKLIAGARYDRYSASLTNSRNAPSSASQTVKFTSVRGGLIYQPSDVQSYYVSYGTSYNPSLETLTLTNGAQSLDPEKSRAYELGGKWELLGGNLATSAAIFQTDKRNARTQVSPGVFELAGNVRVRGFEAGATGRLSRTWQVLAGYTYLNARLVDTAPGDTANPEGNTLANTPTHSGALWVAYTPTREWEYGTGITAMTERYNSNANVVSVPYYLRWDATIAYHLPKYDIRFNLLNITNRLNYEQLIPSDRGRSVPSTDRMALLTFTARF